MNHDDLYEEAMDAISRLFYDKSVPISTTEESLRGLVMEIETMIDALHDNEPDVEPYSNPYGI